MRRRLSSVLLGAMLVLITPLALAQDNDFAALVATLPDGSYSDRAEVVTAIALTGDERAAAVLNSLLDGDLFVIEADNRVVMTVEAGGQFIATDPVTLEDAGTFASGALERVRVNNGLRRTIRTALGTLTLMNPDPQVRTDAARSMFRAADPESLEMLDEALAAETDARVAAVMRQARAAVVLAGESDEATKIAAVEALTAVGSRDALAVLTGARGAAEGDLAAAIDAAATSIRASLAVWDVGQNVWYGISLGSVLLLAAIGLAITFGVMGVINMAHGEMVMLGAYTTFYVQFLIRQFAPGLLDQSLLIALPVAFLVTALIGVAIERGIIRWLYGRPLETLLATWGLSLILQQTVRSVFGPTNQLVIAPTWMSGSVDFYGLAITWNRLWIVIFATIVFALLLVVLNRTPLGLQMRAVTQNRRMASAIGIRTPYVDAMTFGLGSGIAGLAGVALTQIDNISPNLGQSYIIDSFMVVVFGGVGNLWGTLVGAMTLGVVNKFLEPYAGAVLGKILVLVFIILFIQRRPRGLFALRGRAVEA